MVDFFELNTTELYQKPFSKLFKTATGESPSEFIDSLEEEG